MVSIEKPVPKEGSLLRSFFEADDKLYRHEEPLYRYAATGFPMHFAEQAFCVRFEEERKAYEAICDFLKAALEIERHYGKKTNQLLEAL